MWEASRPLRPWLGLLLVAGSVSACAVAPADVTVSVALPTAVVAAPLAPQPVIPREPFVVTPAPATATPSPAPTTAATAAPSPTSPPTELPTAVPAPTPTGPDLEPLRIRLEQLAAGWGGQNAVAVTDVQTGQRVSVGGERPQLAACTIKIAIMIAVAQDVEAGIYTAEDVAGLVQSAMGPSNTPPARELLRIIGGGDIGAGLRRANAIMWGLGATGSIITHPPGYPWEEYGYQAELGQSQNLLTADDLSLMLARVYRGEALSPAATAYLLDSMAIAPDWMDGSFGVALPPEARLYHKVGQLYGPAVWNDAGIVVFERGGQTYAYTIAYLGSLGGSWDEHYAYAGQASAAAWEFFRTAYP